MPQARVNRGEFLQVLESVQPGLSPREIVEQSNCFVFKDGRVLTFNEEVSCQADSGFPDKFHGAVTAKPLLQLLGKITDEDLTIEMNGESMFIHRRRGRTRLRMDPKITLPLESLEAPEDWKGIPRRFNDAVSIVQECASKDESQFALTCVHIHPKWIEACDNLQMTRYRLKVNIPRPILVKRDAIRPVLGLDMTEFSETADWLHFRNPAGLIYSCRRYPQKYHDLRPYLNMNSGVPSTLPKGLAAAADVASIFSSENKDEDLITVEMRPGKMRVTGEGDSGDDRKYLDLKYKGKNVAFNISPKLLIEIVKRHTEVIISKEQLKVQGERWVYISCLGDPQEVKEARTVINKEPEEPEESEEESDE